jgi:hypothetical protein
MKRRPIILSESPRHARHFKDVVPGVPAGTKNRRVQELINAT